MAVAGGAAGEETGVVSPPAQLEAEAIIGLGEVKAGRRKLVELALDMGREMRLKKYIYGSADPERGGFDCSGAVYYLLRKRGLEPPRTSAGQFEWIKNAGLLTEVPADTPSLDAEVFSKLKPGDLLFWSGTYRPTDGRTNKITHVQIYLGRETSDARPVMIGSTNGRSYRGRRQCGFGVFDFRLPRAGSKSKFVGFGTPPGLLDPA